METHRAGAGVAVSGWWWDEEPDPFLLWACLPTCETTAVADLCSAWFLPLGTVCDSQEVGAVRGTRRGRTHADFIILFHYLTCLVRYGQSD